MKLFVPLLTATLARTAQFRSVAVTSLCGPSGHREPYTAEFAAVRLASLSEACAGAHGDLASITRYGR